MPEDTPKKDPAAVSLGRRGGLSRAKKLSKKELSEQGRKAIQARWAKTKENQAPESKSSKKAKKGKK